MPVENKSFQYLRLDERNHVENPFLDQLAGLGWEIIDLDSKQHTGDTFRETFTEVVVLPVLRAQLRPESVIRNFRITADHGKTIKKLTKPGPKKKAKPWPRTKHPDTPKEHGQAQGPAPTTGY